MTLWQPTSDGVHEATRLLKHFSIKHLPRSKNQQADALSKQTSSFEDRKAKQIQSETLIKRSIDPHEVLWLDRSLHGWTPHAYT